MPSVLTKAQILAKLPGTQEGTILMQDIIESIFAYVDTSTATSAAAVAQLAGVSADVLFYSGAGAPVDYTDGTPPATGEAVAEIGSLYMDETNGKLYINGGTKAEPVWKLVTSAA